MINIKYYLEHLEETLLNQDNSRKVEALFALLFDERPTVADIYFGAAKLACVFKLNEEWKKAIGQKYPLSDPSGLNPVQILASWNQLRLIYQKSED